jgi:hypothetical protein
MKLLLGDNDVSNLISGTAFRFGSGCKTAPQGFPATGYIRRTQRAIRLNTVLHHISNHGSWKTIQVALRRNTVEISSKDRYLKNQTPYSSNELRDRPHKETTEEIVTILKKMNSL